MNSIYGFGMGDYSYNSTGSSNRCCSSNSNPIFNNGCSISSQKDAEIIDNALQMAGVPPSDGMYQIASKHYAAMKKGTSFSSTSANNKDNQKNDDNVSKLAEFVSKYYSMHGDDPSNYMQKVGQLAQQDFASQGKSFIDPTSGFFDPKNQNFYQTGLAFGQMQREISSNNLGMG